MGQHQLDLIDFLLPGGQWTWDDGLIVIPRSHAKTSLVSKAFVLWCILTERVHFIALFSNIYSQSTSILADLRRTLKTNPRILAAWGSLLDASAPGVRDNDAEIITSTGICFRVAGSGVETRGWTFGPYRPQLILGDDIESRDSVATKTQRDKLERWWDADVQPMRDLAASRILIVGTILHTDSLLNRKLKHKTARTFFRSALQDQPTRKDLWDEWAQTWTEQGKDAADAFYRDNASEMERGARVLWPDGMPLKMLMERKREVGAFAFQTEYQNEPVADGSTLVSEAWLTHRPTFLAGESPMILDGSEQIALADLRTISTVDVAISQKEGADYFVITTGGRTKDGRIYIWDVVRTHLTAPEQIRAIFQVYAKWHAERVRIEVVAYQQALKEMVDEAGRREGVYLPTEGYHPDKDKVRRMTRWQPLFEQGLVRFCDTVPSSCIDELLSFPLGEHDDFVDTVTMLLDGLASSPRFVGVTAI